MGSLSHLEGKATVLSHGILHGEIGQGFNRLQGCGIAKARAGCIDGLSDTDCEQELGNSPMPNKKLAYFAADWKLNLLIILFVVG